MANSFLNAKQYANSFLLLLKNQLVMGRLIDGKYKDQVTDQNGLSIYVKRPPQFIAKTGATLAAQAIVTGETPVSVTRYRNVHCSLTDLEAVQSFNQLMKSETMKSMASTLAHDVDLYAHQQLLSFPSHVGTIGETVKTPAQFLKVHTRLMDLAVPNFDLSGVLTFEDAELIRGSLLTGNIQGVNRTSLEKTRVPIMSEIDAYATQHITKLTVGTRVATSASQVDGAATNVNYVSVKDADFQTLLIKNSGTSKTFVVGDTFTIADVYAVNNKANNTVLPFLRQFVVMEAVTGGSGGDATLKIWPPIIVPGTGGGEADTNTAFATVNSVPADSAALSFVGVASTAYLTRAAWHKPAIQAVWARLETPMSDESSFATDPDTGISIRYWRGSDIATGIHSHRFDMIYGIKCVDPRLGTRFSGASS